jgi:hypothetical protein
MPEIERSRFEPYFRVRVSVCPTRASSTFQSAM